MTMPHYIYLFSFKDKAPLSKGLLLVPSTLSVLLALLFQHYQKFFIYNLQAIKEEFQVTGDSFLKLIV